MNILSEQQCAQRQHSMGLQDIILNKVLKIVDNTIGKKFKIVDDLTDLVQGSEGRLDKLEERIKSAALKASDNRRCWWVYDYIMRTSLQRKEV